MAGLPDLVVELFGGDVLVVGKQGVGDNAPRLGQQYAAPGQHLLDVGFESNVDVGDFTHTRSITDSPSGETITKSDGGVLGGVRRGPSQHTRIVTW
jgi:hypothetical protein